MILQWKETQDTLKFTLQRQLYGVHMPVRQLMERSLVGHSPHMPARGTMNNLHLDILTGNDELLETKDLFVGGALTEFHFYPGCQLITRICLQLDLPNLPMDMHRDMEKKLKM